MERLIGLVGIAIISFSAVFVRLADVSPTTAAFFRAAYAWPVLLVIAWLVRHRDRRDSRARWMAFGSGLFLAADLICWHHSIAAIGAGLGTVLGNTQIMFVGIAAWFLHRERPTRLALMIVPLVFVGVVLVSGLGREGAYGVDPVAGVMYGVSTGIFYASKLPLASRWAPPPSVFSIQAFRSSRHGPHMGGSSPWLSALRSSDGFSFRTPCPAWQHSRHRSKCWCNRC
jgi:drug/metabolite transporter (DMT)-like permease